MMTYTVLSPWAETDSSIPVGLSPRVLGLDGKTIGLFGHFKYHSPFIMRELEALLAPGYPGARFSHYQYVRDMKELVNDPEHFDAFTAWLSGVDAVIGLNGDAGSCSMFLASNMAYMEKQGKPCVMLADAYYYSSARRGASARAVPGLRIVKTPLVDLTWEPEIDERVINGQIRPALQGALDEIVAGLTRPLTEEEKNPQPKADFSKTAYTGTLEEINRIFYENGWTNGLPVIPPTEEAVLEMLQGTDLPRDHVVGLIPPMLGKATVEKIAVNAVMAGCLPTYMPVLVAAVQGMLDPRIQLEGWTCSNASWSPLSILNGPVARDLNVHSGSGVLSPYFKPNATIPRAVAYMVMNIGGVRPQLEDMSVMGHMGRFGTCFAENEAESPWAPLHTLFGFDESDSAITMFWPSDMQQVKGSTIPDALTNFCKVRATGWATGAVLIISPEMAKMFAEDGWNQGRILDYILEYNRVPASEWDMRWIIGNNHVPSGVELPLNPAQSARRFWNKEHLFIAVAGRSWATALTGGGDHGGPSCTKIALPKNWRALVEKYKTAVPRYIDY